MSSQTSKFEIYAIYLYHQVHVEPKLQPVNDPGAFFLLTANTQDGAKLDIALNGFWGGCSEQCYVDARVFNPYVASNLNSLSVAYKQHENIKRHVYGQRIRKVEHASFTPIVMSAIGGLANETSTFYRWPLCLHPNGATSIVL